jgi:uncharacterized protein YecE (DUF72 family)
MESHRIYIGTSGWSYKHWRGTFYPEQIKVKNHFFYYLQHFNTVEINNTFYGIPSDETFINWEKKVPDDFIYVIKANRNITHLKKLHEPSISLPPFLDRVKLLDKKLGPILFQLPPFMKSNVALFESFLHELPKNYRYVFEFRNADWYKDEIYQLLKEYNCAFCIYELAGHLSPLEVTADFVYLRLHGPGNKYQGSYSNEALKKWAEQCSEWLKTKDVFVYFDNDEKGYAAFNALKLKEIINNFNFVEKIKF